MGPFATGEGARFADVPASSVGEREKGVLGRSEKETWEGREREEFEFFLKGLDVFTRVLKGKVVFFAVCELSKAEALDLNGRSGSKELQPCNSFGIACDMDPKEGIHK